MPGHATENGNGNEKTIALNSLVPEKATGLAVTAVKVPTVLKIEASILGAQSVESVNANANENEKENESESGNREDLMTEEEAKI